MGSILKKYVRKFAKSKFASETSFHGVSYAGNARNAVQFGFWILAISICFACFVWETYTICLEFTTTPYVTYITMEKLDVLPSVGICLKYPIDYDKVVAAGLTSFDEVAYIFGYLPAVGGINERSPEYWNELMSDSNFTERISEIRSRFPTYSELIKSLTLDLNTRIINVTADCDLCINKGNITITPYIKPSGVCFKTSEGYIDNPMAVPELRISHNLHQYEQIYEDYTLHYDLYFDDFYDGFPLNEGRVSSEHVDLTVMELKIESENTAFDDDFDASVPVISEALVLLRRTKFTYKQNTGTCIPDSLLRSDRAGCLRACVNDRHPECGLHCVDYLGEEYEQQLESDVEFCLLFNRTQEQTQCLQHVTTECKAECPHACNDAVYELTVLPFIAENKQSSETRIMSDLSLKEWLLTEEGQQYYEYDPDSYMFMDNMSTVEDPIFYQRQVIIRPLHPDNLPVVEEVDATTPGRLLANIAGFFGLFLGGSLLTVVHLLYACTFGRSERRDDDKFSTEPYLNQVEIQALNDFPLIGVCPEATIDARKVKEQGLTLEDAALVFGTLPSVVGLDGKTFNGTRLAELRSMYATHADLLKSLSVDYSERFSVSLESDEDLQLSTVVKSGGVCLVASIPPGRNNTEAGVKFSNPFASLLKSWKEIRNESFNPQFQSQKKVIDSKIKLMFGNQVFDFSNYGDAEISEIVDAAIVVQINRKNTAYEPGRCLRVKDQRQDGVSCYDHCVYERRKQCGVNCLDYYLGEALERYVIADTGSNISFCPVWIDSTCVSSVNQKCALSCPRSCYFESYEVNLVNMPIGKGNPALKVMLEDVRNIPLFSSMSLLSSWNNSEEWMLDVKKNRTYFEFVVKIHSPDRLMVINEVAIFTGHTLLANFAGLLGLFLGVSLLTVAHAVYFWTCGLMTRRKKGRKNRKYTESAVNNDESANVTSHYKKFMSETSMHGWDSLGNTVDTKVKVFWLFSICICMGVMISEMYQIGFEFSRDPYATVYKDESFTSFPKVAICPADSINPVAAMLNRLTLEVDGDTLS